MIHDIGTGIVTFLLGSVCTYFLGKWSNIFGKIDSLEFGVRALLRNRMIQTVNYYREKQRAVPQWELANFDQLFLTADFPAPTLEERVAVLESAIAEVTSND